METGQTRRLGILVGGGPAPGLNSATSAATIEAVNNGLGVRGEGYTVLFFLDLFGNAEMTSCSCAGAELGVVQSKAAAISPARLPLFTHLLV